MRGRRDRHIGVRLTGDELGRLRSGAEGAELSLSDYVRQAALAGRVLPREALEELRRLRIEFNRIGVNLNQLARRLNRGDQPGQEQIRQLIQELSRAAARLREMELRS